MTRTSGNTQSLLKTKFITPFIDHEPKDSTIIEEAYSNKRDEFNEYTSEILSTSFSDDEKYGTQSKAHSTSLKNHDPVKRIIRKVFHNVEGVSEHVDSVIEFQMRRQNEEMDLYINHQLHRIMLDIRAAEEASIPKEQDVPFASTFFNIKRINNNRASRLSRLKKKKRMESARLGLFCYNQFNEDLDRESRRLRAKIEKQLQFLAEGGVDVNAEIRLRAKMPKTKNELEQSTELVANEHPSISGEYLSVSNEYLSVSSESMKDASEYTES